MANCVTEKRGNPHRKKKKRNRSSKNKAFKMCIKTIGAIRGFNNEELFVKALSDKFKKPSWYVGWRRATGSDDHHKSTDVFIHSYFCDVRIDVKSSYEYAAVKEKELLGVGMCDVVVIVVMPHMTAAEIRSGLFSKIEKHLKFKFGRFANLGTVRRK